MDGRRLLVPALGFASAAMMTTALSTYVLFLGYFASRLHFSPSSLALWGSVIYFAGMPVGKVIGRAARAYRRLPLLVVALSAVIALSIALMPLASSFAELMALRFVQGTATVFMEVFSNAYSFLYDSVAARDLAASVSISGIPAGVAIGTSAYVLASGSPTLVFPALSAASFLVSAAYAAVLSGLREPLSRLRHEEAGTTYRMGRTWLMGLLWATIAGFNLVLSILLPPYVSSYSPADVPLAMEAFGYSAALLTILGGAVGYMARSLSGMLKVVAAGYAASVIGFVLLWLEPKGALLALSIVLINLEAFAVPFIYAVPRHIYPDGLVAKGTWEFALIGSSFHVWSSLMVLDLGFSLGFRPIVLLLIIPPIYGLSSVYWLPRLAKSK